VSNDTDFIQLIQQYPHVKVWNPIKKEYLEPPEAYDYVTWKALRGDGSDNVPGIPGVGDKTAADVASDPERLAEFLARASRAEQFSRNYELISFQQWSPEDMLKMTSTSPSKDWERARSVFSGHGFSSIVKDESWKKFVGTFDPLWG